MQKVKMIAGIDGGGTKTRVLCCDLQGKQIAAREYGPFNLNSIGEEAFRKLMMDITSFLNAEGDCTALCIGAAGVSNPRMGELIAQAMKTAGITRWKLVGDQEIALWGALEGSPGVSVVAGTGSICCGRNEAGDYITVGGWGHLIGDEGSGYAIGRDVLKAVTHYWDGYGEETSLIKAVIDTLHLEDRQQMIAYVYENSKSSVAKAARIAEQEAASGDAVAKKILLKNAIDLAKLVKAATVQLSMQQGEIALLGGLLENDTIYRKNLVKEIQNTNPGFVCVAPKQNALTGAVLMAQTM